MPSGFPSSIRALIGLALLACAVPAVAQDALPDGARTPGPQVAYVPGEAIVRFDAGASAADRLDARRAAGVTLDRALPLRGAQVVETDGSVQAAVRRLERRPEVAYAQPNYRYRATAEAPDDTFFGSLWGLSDTALPNPGVNVLDAWDTTQGSGQVVAVLDTGVALDHPDLVGNLWTNPDETPGGGDDDGNGFGDDVDGYDFIDDDADPDDYDFHGTHVAGTVAATADNDLGIAGVAPAAEIMPVRVLDGDGGGTSATVAEGIEYAAQEGADVLNLSLSGPAGAGDELMSDAVDLANSLDALVVVAAGNDGSDNDAEPTTPCTLPQPNLICVAALNQSGALASFSNFGRSSVDLAAPGTGILSTETDYATIFSDGFASGLSAWTTATVNGGLPWSSVTNPNSDGTPSATDSSGGDYANAVDPEEFAESRLFKTDGLDLSSQRGCRLHFDVRYDLEEDFDLLEAGAVDGGLTSIVAQYFTGSTGGGFDDEEVSISGLDGEADVSPWFTVLSDNLITDDGAYVDDVRVLCRDDSYSDALPPTGNYVSFSGTSMASPHVAGVAALVRAADPAAPDTEVAQALKAGTEPIAALKCKVVAGGTSDARAAIEAALALPGTPASVPNGCPLPPGNPPPGDGSGGPKTAGDLSPAKPNLAGAARSVRVSRKGSFRYRFRATPGLTGDARFRTRRKAEISRRGHLTVAGKRFTVPGDGRVTVKVKLTKRKLRILRRNGKLALKVTVTVRNTAGLSAKASKRLTLKAPKR